MIFFDATNTTPLADLFAANQRGEFIISAGTMLDALASDRPIQETAADVNVRLLNITDRLLARQRKALGNYSPPQLSPANGGETASPPPKKRKQKPSAGSIDGASSKSIGVDILPVLKDGVSTQIINDIGDGNQDLLLIAEPFPVNGLLS